MGIHCRGETDPAERGNADREAKQRCGQRQIREPRKQCRPATIFGQQHGNQGWNERVQQRLAVTPHLRRVEIVMGILIICSIAHRITAQACAKMPKHGVNG